ncbi:hypothetical protein DSM3645_02968 [Blastopirellula marina DSM 3645]|uniref:Uncharacterized protein n=1 Tax=Blastopirellula marina DSM 3645 TaxID=314230 RepID=A3ZVQ7_9BACT|nr:hypothetical protein DSM3645_02968 [Blastopirellula marina DSM 3645]
MGVVISTMLKVKGCNSGYGTFRIHEFEEIETLI